MGDKEREGDGRTPEGIYSIDYQECEERFPPVAPHIIPRREPIVTMRGGEACRPGGDIMIHGLPNGFAMLGPLYRLMDWTDGCIAVTNGEIEEIWAMTDVGTEIEIQE